MVGKPWPGCYKFAPQIAGFKGWRGAMTVKEHEGTANGNRPGWLRRLVLPLGLGFALALLGGCGSSETSLSGETWLRDRVLFGISSKEREKVEADAQQAADTKPPEVDYESLPCPPAEIRTSGTTYTIYARGELPGPKVIRYQGTLIRVSRECNFRPGDFSVRFGFAGRVLVGPMGGEGTLTLPVKAEFATTGDRVVWSKVYKIPVTIAAGQTSVPFSHVTDDLVYQPKPGEPLYDFRLYLGFETPDER